MLYIIEREVEHLAHSGELSGHIEGTDHAFPIDLVIPAVYLVSLFRLSWAFDSRDESMHRLATSL